MPLLKRSDTCILSSTQISEFPSHTISELQASPCHDDHGTVPTAPRSENLTPKFSITLRTSLRSVTASGASLDNV
ncbi:hypothetical protein M0R45_023655 [Rubus argutus]|uniref:Uncharacterized protein n=1 Tax=Rubus argutus TaxID=59490 RepID=A0AAW1WP86_RUBAR